MKQQLNKLTSTMAGAGIFLVGCVMVGLGLSVVFMLAMFALAVIGLGMLATPLLALARQPADETTREAAA